MGVSIEKQLRTYSGLELYNMEVTEIPFLVERLIPKGFVTALSASPGIGKTTFARQLAICIATGEKKFLEFKISDDNKRKVLYITTEEIKNQVSFNLKAQFEPSKSEVGSLKNLDVHFENGLYDNSSKFSNKLDLLMNQKQYDIVVIDVFGDVFDGNSMNSSLDMRKAVREIERTMRLNKSTCLIVHHNNKYTGSSSRPSSDNIQGGGGFVQRVKSVLQLTEKKGTVRLYITKANFLRREELENYYALEQNEKSGNFRIKSKESIEVDKPISSDEFHLSNLRSQLISKRGLSNGELLSEILKVRNPRARKGQYYASTTAKTYREKFKGVLFIEEEEGTWEIRTNTSSPIKAK
ncbi:MAG: hypothetical protein CL840_08920 [Crocinitomicaceae bacterium]|nr:hypothetical protein [Crocinitomicaceae bacterium]|tara:strand:- start:34927 stop:35982 length:1056 start_codon:yes stop_codon:yes gene_type:complete